MIAVDTSVAVAAFASWHPAHDAAVEVFRREPRIAAHAAVETYAVLTRLPDPYRAPPAVAAAFFERNFADPPLVLGADDYRTLVSEAPQRGIVGGAIFDAVVAATVLASGATLITRDARARRTYETVGVAHELVS